jgi:hypothetical protein
MLIRLGEAVALHQQGRLAEADSLTGLCRNAIPLDEGGVGRPIQPKVQGMHGIMPLTPQPGR